MGGTMPWRQVPHSKRSWTARSRIRQPNASPVSQLERVAPPLLAHSLTNIAADRTNGQWEFFAAWRKGTRKIPRLKKSI